MAILKPLLRRRVRVAPSLSREARQRLRWMAFYLDHGRGIRLTCRHFGISSATFYRWWRGYDPRRLASLEDDRRTRRPKRVRQPMTPPEGVRLIRTLRERYPRWGKAKLAILLRREGCVVSASTIGRTLTRLRALPARGAGRRAGGAAAEAATPREAVCPAVSVGVRAAAARGSGGDRYDAGDGEPQGAADPFHGARRGEPQGRAGGGGAADECGGEPGTAGSLCAVWLSGPGDPN